jgi:lysozyme
MAAGQGVHPAVKGAAWVTICVSCVSGFEGLRTIAYKDPVGIPTICFGETHGVKLGDKATPAECKDMLADRVVEFSIRLQAEDCLGSETWNRLFPKTQAALVSIVYNVGPGKYGVKDGLCELKTHKRPSTMVSRFRAGADKLGCQEFMNWANPPLPGIKRRRTEEMNLCLAGVAEAEKELQ